MESMVLKKFESYPNKVNVQMLALRQLVFDVAQELSLGEVDETLKWGEPSYSVKGASPLRMDWKAKTNQLAVYFVCTTKLVDTFRELYSDTLNFKGNRAIVFQLDEEIPITELKHCIALALRYHKIKHLPLLGA